MAQKFENLPPNWDDFEEERQHVSLNCPWTITSEDDTLAIVIACLKWTFNYDFWIRVTAHPERVPNNSKRIDLNKHHPLFEPLSEALNDYVVFLEPHLNSHQFRILGERLDFLF